LGLQKYRIPFIAGLMVVLKNVTFFSRHPKLAIFPDNQLTTFMKKLFAIGIAFSLYLICPAVAQFEKGDQYWGGTIRFNGGSSQIKITGNASRDTKEVLHDIAPELQWGTFVKKNTMVGLGLRYILQLTSFKDDGIKERGNIQSLYFQPFIRNYMPLSENWTIFLHTELTPGFSKTNEEGTPSSTQWNYGASLRPGVAYSLPSKKLAIEAYANVLSLQTNYIPSNSDSGGFFTFQAGITSAFPT
jgi:hypothetical protein